MLQTYPRLTCTREDASNKTETPNDGSVCESFMACELNTYILTQDNATSKLTPAPRATTPKRSHFRLQSQTCRMAIRLRRLWLRFSPTLETLLRLTLAGVTFYRMLGISTAVSRPQAKLWHFCFLRKRNFLMKSVSQLSALFPRPCQ